MLSKLLKYELKATGRIFLPLFVALLMFAGITRFTSPPMGPEEWATPAIISMFIYIIIMVGMFIMTFIMMIQRFKNNLLSDEGYLMHTLPAKPWNHIVSKLFVSMLWIVVSGIAAFISILIIALQKGDLTKFTEEFGALHRQAFDHLGTSIYFLSFEFIIGTLVTLASVILIVYASISMGHLFNQHKMLASFGAFIVLSTLSQLLFMLLNFVPEISIFSNFHIPSGDFVAMQAFFRRAMAYGITITGLQCAAYFAITHLILSKRLNLE